MFNNDGIELQKSKGDESSGRVDMPLCSEFSNNLFKIDGSEPLNLVALTSTAPDVKGLVNHNSSSQALKLSPESCTEAFQIRLGTIADNLSAQYDQLQSRFNKEHDSQGVIGKAFDAAKNYAGTDKEGDSLSGPGALWAQLCNRSAGSEASEGALKSAAQEISELRRAATENDLVKFGSIYRSLTGKEFDENRTTVDTLQVKHNVDNYRASQENGVELISDIGAVAASIGALRLGQGTVLTNSLYTRLGTGFVAGAASKCLVKQVDGKYASLPVDLITGGINGLAFPAAESEGLSFAGAPLKHGLGVAAGVENASRSSVLEIRDGQHIDGYKLLNDAVTGYGVGYASATALMGSIAALSSGIRFGSTALEAGKPLVDTSLSTALAKLH